MKKPALALICLSVCLLTLPSLADKTVAIVGSKKISLDEFEKRYREVVEQTLNPPDRQLFLEDLVRYEVGLQEAQKQNLQEDSQVREKINQELYKGLIEKELAKKVEAIQVTEEEMKNYYKKYPEVRTSHILTEYPPESSAEQVTVVRKRAEEIYQEVRKSKKSFEDLVKLYSDDSRSKKNGGDVGWQSRLTVAPSYYEAAIQMKLNEVKGLVKTQFGFHIIKLTGRKPYAEAHKKSLRNSVFDLKRKEIFDGYFSALMKKYKIQMNKGLVN